MRDRDKGQMMIIMALLISFAIISTVISINEAHIHEEKVNRFEGYYMNVRALVYEEVKRAIKSDDENYLQSYVTSLNDELGELASKNGYHLSIALLSWEVQNGNITSATVNLRMVDEKHEYEETLRVTRW